MVNRHCPSVGIGPHIRVFAALSIIVFVLAPSGASAAPGGCLDGGGVELLPYIPAETIAGGPVRILFAGEAGRAAYMARVSGELAGCRFGTWLTIDRTGFAPYRASGDAAAGPSFRDMLAEGWDAVWLDADMASMPAGDRDALLAAVAAGTGLVLVGDGRDLAGFRTEKVTAPAFDVLQYGRFVPTAAGRHGKGMLCAIPALLPDTDQRGGGDYIVSSLAAIMTAAERSGSVLVTGIDLPRRLELEAMDLMTFRIRLESAEDRPMHVRCVYRGGNNEIVAETEARYNIASGRSYVTVDLPRLHHGEFSLDVIVTDEENGLWAVAGRSFPVQSVIGLGDLSLWSRRIAEGEVVGGHIRLDGQFEEALLLQAALRDICGNTLATERLDVVRGNRFTTFTFLVPGTRGPRLDFGISLVRSNTFVEELIVPLMSPARLGGGSQVLVVGEAPDAALPQFVRFDWLPSATVPTAVALPFTAGTGLDRVLPAVAAAGRAGASALPVLALPDEPGGGSIQTVLATADSLAHTGVSGCIVAWDSSRYGANPPELYHEARDAFARADTPAGPDHHALAAAVEAGADPADWRQWVSLVDVPAVSSPLPARPFLRLFGGKDAVGLLTVPASEPVDIPTLRALPWRALFAGIAGIRWEHGWEGPDAAFGPDGTPDPAFAAVLEESAIVSGGIDRMLAGAQGLGDNVAILYEPGAAAAFTATWRALRSLGYDPAAVTAADLRDASMVPAVLVTAGTPSGNAADAVAAFARAGGTVINDLDTVDGELTGAAQPPVVPDPGLGGTDITVFRDGAALYLGVLADPAAGSRGGTGRLTVTLPRGPWHAYDSRDGVFLGVTGGPEVTLEPGEGRVIALLPYLVRRLAVELEKTVTMQGQRLGFTVSVETDSGRAPASGVLSPPSGVSVETGDGITPGRHVFEVRLTDPAGDPRPWRTQYLDAPGGTAAGSLQFYSTDPPGQWTLAVRDAATGKTAQRTIMVITVPSSTPVR